MADRTDASSHAGRTLETTTELLDRVRAGDHRARESLCTRYLPILRRWARGRLPSASRHTCDTDDLVQVALVRALDHVQRFRSPRRGAFFAFLRTTVLNLIRDEVRQTSRRPTTTLPDDLTDDRPTLIEEIAGRDAVRAYEEALARLPDLQQEAVMLRIELGFSFQEIADLTAAPSANAARMTVTRAVVQLAEVLDDHR